MHITIHIVIICPPPLPFFFTFTKPSPPQVIVIGSSTQAQASIPMWITDKRRGPWTLALCLTTAVGMTKLVWQTFCKLVSKTHCCRLKQLKSRVHSHTVLHHAYILDHFQYLNFDLSRLLKLKCVGGIGFPIYDFLWVFNSNIGPNSAPLGDISLWNLSSLDIDLSRSLKVKCDVIGVSIYGFLYI